MVWFLVGLVVFGLFSAGMTADLTVTVSTKTTGGQKSSAKSEVQNVRVTFDYAWVEYWALKRNETFARTAYLFHNMALHQPNWYFLSYKQIATLKNSTETFVAVRHLMNRFKLSKYLRE